MIGILSYILLLLIIYTYIGYPLLITLISFFYKKNVTPNPHWQPTVSILLAVKNEELTIKSKLQDLHLLNYPKEKLELIILANASTDQTTQIASEFPSKIKTTIMTIDKSGKSNALNLGVSHATNEILLFTDCRQSTDPDSLKKVLELLADSNIGVVSGFLVHKSAESSDAANIGLYWRYERFIREKESLCASIIGTTGCFYVMRKSDYQPINQESLVDDLEIPLASIKAGKRSIINKNALVYDILENKSTGEYRRKTRTLTGNFQLLSQNLWLLNPISNPYFFNFFSHKFLRLLAPFAAFLLLILCFISQNPQLKLLLYLQLFFYTSALIGMLNIKFFDNKLTNFSKNFVIMNLAVLHGFYNFITNNKNVWTQSPKT